MGFETFQRNTRTNPMSQQKTISILASGIASISAASYEAMGKPEQVELLFDPETRRAALKPVEEKTENSYELKHRGKAGAQVQMSGFCSYNNIPRKPSRVFDATLEDGMLVFDVDHPVKNIHRNDSNEETSPLSPKRRGRAVRRTGGGLPDEVFDSMSKACEWAEEYKGTKSSPANMKKVINSKGTLAGFHWELAD